MKKPTQKAKQLTSTKLQKELKRVIPASMQKKAPTRIKGITPASKGKPFVDKVKLTETASLKKIKADNVRLIRQLEKQKRELEIEAALEKVRAATSAMVKTDELSKVVSVMYKQFESLEPNQIGIELILCDVAKDQLQFWSSSFSQKKLPERYTIQKESHPLFRKQWNAWKAKKDRLVIRLDETRYKEFCKFIFSQTDFKNFPDHVKKYIRSRKKDVFTHALMKYGLLEAVAAEALSNDSFGVLQRFAKVFEQTYTRFLDLQKAEAQARESQVEAALERVRSRSLAMHNSEELRDVVSLFYEQMELFGFAKGGCELILCNEKSGFLEYWHTNPVQSSVPECLNVSPGIHDFFDQVWKSWKNQEPQLVIEMRGKEKHKMDIALLEKTDFKKLDKKTKNWILSDKVAIFSHAIMKYGLLEAVDYLPLHEDQFSILQRFAKIFEQTYTRFLDLQKAEAQAREAQIEAALERVRSRSLAMHKSDELNEVIAVLYEQMQLLRVGDWGCSLNIYNETENYFEIWLSTDAQRISLQSFRIEGQGHQLIKELWDIWKSQEQFRFIELKGAVKVDYDEYVMSQTGLKHLPDNIKKAIKSLPESYASIAAMKHGTLNSYTGQNPFSKTEFLVFQRFAKVFEQAYTRFLDLQKAEAQAREAQIEAALERIRSRTMAMQKPDELLEVGGLLYKELSNLGVSSLTSGYTLVDKDGKMDWNYVASPEDGSIASKPLGAPRDETKVMRSMTASWEKQEPFLVIELNPQETIRHQTYIAGNLINFSITAEQLISVTPERLVLQTFNFEQGYLLIVGAEKLSDENVKMIVRFARVFEMTYKRFLDLQKAVVQAREAEIELALERVRARTMAMHKSEELPEVVFDLFRQMHPLGFAQWGCALALADGSRGGFEVWFSTPANRVSADHYFFPNHGHPVSEKIWDIYQKQVELFILELKDDEKVGYTKWLFNATSLGNMPENDIVEILSERYVMFSFAAMKFGLMEAISHEPMPPELANILPRFAKVFEQTYTRFLDLQKAEAQAREAEIQLALERIRARTMAMHKSEELGEVSETLYAQLQNLDITQFINCGYLRVDEENKIQSGWASMPGDKPMPFSLPLGGDPVLTERIKAWKEGVPVITQKVSGKTLTIHLKNVMPFLGSREVEEMVSTQFTDPTFFYIGSLRSGYLFLVSNTPLNNQQLSLFDRFTRAFELAFQRFLDLQKAEAQAREAQIEAALERVRSRTMAMHKSTELAEVSALLYKELQGLGVTQFLNCGYVEIDEVNHIQNAWMTNADGLGVNVVQLPLTGDSVFDERYEAWKRKDKLFHQVVGGDVLKNHIELGTQHYRKTEIDELVRTRFPDPTIFYCGNFNYGYLNIITGTSLTEEQESLLIRFTKVFEMTYGRFLDLQKAEAQAREAQIEVALERVRAASMAMYKSEELPQVALVLLEQLEALGVTDLDCGINIVDPDTKDFISYSAHSIHESKQKEFHEFPKLNLNDFGFLRKAIESVDAGQMKFTLELKDELYEEIMNVWDIHGYPGLNNKSDFDEVGVVYLHVAQFHRYSSISTSSLSKLSEEKMSILQRMAKTFGMSYTRFLDLQKAEAQAREAQVEVALERVRSRTMAMHKSDELNEVAFDFFNQLHPLGIAKWGFALWLADETNQKFDVWFSTPTDRVLPEPYSVPIKGHPVINKIWAAYENKSAHCNIELANEEKRAWDLWLFENSGMKNLPDAVKDSILSHPYVQFSFTSMRYGLLDAIDVNRIPDEQLLILQRFAKVYEQTYTRFLDLQKAEAQAKEAEIELALERVRARTMAMHKSDELSEVASLLFQQIGELGIKVWTAGFNVWLNNDNAYQDWITSPKGGFIEPYLVDTTQFPVFIEVREAKQRGDDFLVQFVGGEMIKAMYGELSKFAPQQFEIMLQDGFEFPKHQYDHFVFGSTVSLMFITFEPLPEAHDIFKRFGKVFEQTYTRFLDLQKAEAQAREAEIQLALERIRARSMAMQSTEELREVVQVMYDQVGKLGIAKWGCMLMIFDEEKQIIQGWFSEIVNAQYPRPFDFDNKDHPIIQKWWDFWESNEELLSIHLRDEEKYDFGKYLFTKTGMKYMPDEVKEVIMNEPQVYFEYTNMDCGIVEFIDVEPFPEESIPVLKRITNVFEQTYTRFLDLQKAEAQAREAHIEAALERVRSRSMAMRHSTELNIILAKVFEELTNLELQMERAVIWIYYPENRSVRWWAANPEAESGTESFYIANQVDPVYDEYWKAWEERRTKDLYILEGDYKENWTEILFNKTELGRLPEVVKAAMVKPEKLYLYNTFNDFGVLFISCLEPLSDDKFTILGRFGKVFDQSYTRFKDIQQAEAREKEAIRQASLDRVRAEIASMRTTTDLERITPLIWKELITLNISFVRCGVFIMDESLQQMHTFLSTPDGKAIAAFHLPYDSPGRTSEILAHWMNKQVYIEHWDETAFSELGDLLVQQGALPSKDVYLKTVPQGGIYLHCLPFMQGMLYVGNSVKLNEDDIQLIQSVADAFATAYARYEDFNKLEAAKQQVDKTLTELRQTQQQLVHSEKMASLGELTAGIAHEIQNPLNFVNNFSEVNTELIEEANEELDKGNTTEVKSIMNNIKDNEEKINHHGKRAGDIVKGMLQHSRTSSGQKELTDINALCDEYLRLSYHGLRAKDKSFKAKFETDFDSSIPKLNVVPQDIGRVILNLINNAFYAVNERLRQSQPGNHYEPIVIVSTRNIGDKIEVRVKDNGCGIPENIREKIFQPFFTTKPTGQGTGLGLSLSYDIVKAHGGELKVDTKEGEGSTFIIQIPV